MSLSFHSPVPADRPAVFRAASLSRAKENDAAFASIYLLREKYQTEICFEGDTLLRHYDDGIRAGCYGFPLGAGSPAEIVPLLQKNAENRNQPLRFCMLTNAQCAELEHAFPGKFSFTRAENYTEYLYLRENLSELRGSRYHGKRNHIAQFWRNYPDAYIQPLIPENAELALKIAEQWLAARENPNDPSLVYEYACIAEATLGLAELGISGLLLYAEAEQPPIGMEMISEISPGIWDVHFEKVVPGYPHAWPVVANETAKCLKDAEYLNREEDLGENGMRSSKLSYRPDLLNEKYFALWR